MRQIFPHIEIYVELLGSYCRRVRRLTLIDTKGIGISTRVSKRDFFHGSKFNVPETTKLNQKTGEEARKYAVFISFGEGPGLTHAPKTVDQARRPPSGNIGESSFRSNCVGRVVSADVSADPDMGSELRLEAASRAEDVAFEEGSHNEPGEKCRWSLEGVLTGRTPYLCHSASTAE